MNLSFDLVAERFLAFARNGAKKLWAFSVARVVRTGVRLLLSQVDFLADGARDFLGIPGKEIDWGFFLQMRRKLSGGDFAVPIAQGGAIQHLRWSLFVMAGLRTR